MAVRSCIVLLLLGTHLAADDFQQTLQPLLGGRCADCHSGDEPAGKLALDTLTQQQLLQQPQLLHELLRVVDTGAMPPETVDPLPLDLRHRATVALFALLGQAQHPEPAATPVWRLNRFQYNNTVRDLFQLNRQVLPLPEKLMTRHGSWLTDMAALPHEQRRLPDAVEARSYTLSPEAGLSGVRPFPRDLQAEHGFDNQTDQLTLSPLLLDAFLRLSYSIVDSPDFNAESVRIWDRFFAAPELPDAVGLQQQLAEIRSRLSWFLPLAFRQPVDEATVARYVDYAGSCLQSDPDFTAAMKRVAAAAMSSPLFLLRVSGTDHTDRQFAAASRLSYFLWGSAPDEQLLEQAKAGRLADPAVVTAEVQRMLADPRIERFLDTFPAQWMHLENAVVATPDPELAPWFRLDAERPASLQMILEPLLLFEALFLEDGSCSQLINPTFGYRSEFLQTWYGDQLSPAPVDETQLAADNVRREQQREQQRKIIRDSERQLAALRDPIRARLLLEQQAGGEIPGLKNLEPWAAWEFNGDLHDSLHGLHLTAHGNIEFADGRVVLNKSYLQSESLMQDVAEKTLEVRLILRNPDQPGGGAMGVQGPGDFFDTIVIGERQPRHWISGSNGFARTLDFPGSYPESETEQPVHLMMVYEADGTTRLYRNGQPYGESFNKGKAVFPAGETSILFGLRHLPAGGNRYLNLEIDQARLYLRALSVDEAAAAAAGQTVVIGEEALLAAMSPQQQELQTSLQTALTHAQTALQGIPSDVTVAEAQTQNRQRFEADLRRQMNQWTFRRVMETDSRFGGIVTNAAMLSMTSGPRRTHPVARGVWITEVIFNDPPKPPPNDVPPLDEDAADPNLTIREQFAAHRENPSCAGCHTRLDPLGFALENYDLTGRWRTQYTNGREVDTAGTLLRQHPFRNIQEFRGALQQEHPRIARAFTEHLLRFALARPLTASDSLTVDRLLKETATSDNGIRSLVHAVAVTSAQDLLAD